MDESTELCWRWSTASAIRLRLLAKFSYHTINPVPCRWMMERRRATPCHREVWDSHLVELSELERNELAVRNDFEKAKGPRNDFADSKACLKGATSSSLIHIAA